MLSGWPNWVSSIIAFALLIGAVIGLVRLLIRARGRREWLTVLAFGSASLALGSILFLNFTWVSPAISQKLGNEALRISSAILFFSSMLGIVLSLLGAGRWRILSGAICAGTGCWWLLLVMSAAISMSSPLSRHPVRFLIPEGYIGWIRIVFGVKSAPPLPIENEDLVCKIPASGVLLTSSKLEEGWASDTYYYYRANGSEQRLRETGWGGGGLIWDEMTEREGEASADENPQVFSELFYVGTEQQFKHAAPYSDFNPVKIVP